eukprot:m.6717 g.6717  ORF g.6717 m.6717 type:complete len:512 (-) comp2647_c0_seq4:130-1665(-)
MMAEYVEFTDFGAQNESSTDDGPLPITSLVPMESIYMPPLVRLRFRVRRIVESIWMRLLSLLLVVIDAIVLLVRLSEMKWKFDDTRDEPLGYQIESYFVIAYFVLEVCCRIFALGPKEFFSRRIEVLDFVIIMLSAVLTFVFAFGRIVVVTRLIRIVIIFRLLNENHQLRKATRLLISQNKRRYREDGFDLDLTFVTNRIIAMSYPSSGLTSVYRNPVKEVIRFFNTKYPEHYMLYNLCSERQYDPALFNGRVECFGIDDHNVPTLNAMVAFCENASAFLEADPGNIIAVHCKGGKGRTGTMICALLLYMKQQPTADAALEFFGHRRTDLLISSQFQGVQTPSQSRFVHYFEQIVHRNNCLAPSLVSRTITTVKVLAPPAAVLNAAVGEPGSLRFVVYCENRPVFDFVSAHSLGEAIVQAGYVNLPSGQTILALEFDVGAINVEGEVKIKFTSESLPKAYDSCAFFFWFHTSFIQHDRLYIPREELDNPHKKKTWTLYEENFGVELFFANT